MNKETRELMMVVSAIFPLVESQLGYLLSKTPDNIKPLIKESFRKMINDIISECEERYKKTKLKFMRRIGEEDKKYNLDDYKLEDDE